jgi:cell division septal protein FtsQ
VARGPELTAGRARTRSASPALELVPSGRSLAVGFALLLTALFLYLGARETAVFDVRSIDVQTEPAGHSRLVQRALVPIEGTSLLKVDEGTIARRLDALPHVHLLGYDRSFPDGLRVHVSVERPVAVLRRGDENWLVSGEGRVLRKLDVRLRRPLPVVWMPRAFDPEVGAIIGADAPSRAVAALASLRSAAPKFYGRIWYVAPTEHGLTLVLRDRFEIRLGNAFELALKLEVARRVLVAIWEIGSPATYVDVAVPERPVAGTTLNSEVEP